MIQRLGIWTVLALALCACGMERDLTSQSIPVIQCTILNRPSPDLVCGAAHAFDIRVLGGSSPYTLERQEVEVDPQSGGPIQWAEDERFTTTSDGLYPDSDARWIAVRRYVWGPTGDCQLTPQEKTDLQTRPHQVKETYLVTDAEGRQQTCELAYGITVD